MWAICTLHPQVPEVTGGHFVSKHNASLTHDAILARVLRTSDAEDENEMNAMEEVLGLVSKAYT